MTKERPILFSAPMVRAILDGRKTQTRRALRKQFASDAEPAEVPATSPEGWQISGHSSLWWDDAGACIDDAIRCPYGRPGDRLWVREAWRIGAWNEDDGTFAIDYCDGSRREWIHPFATKDEAPDEVFNRLWIDCCDELNAKRVYPDADGNYRWPPGESPLRWRTSIHMPRWASRILLEVTGVRVERLNDISKDDAMAEGIVMQPDGGFGLADSTHYHFTDPTDSYCSLWESINGAGSWMENPWVWVVEFRRAET